MSKKFLIKAIVLALIVFGIGIFIGTKLPRKIAVSNVVQADTFQAGWDAAKERLKQSSSPLGIATSPNGMEIKNVSGTIQKIDGNKLTVKISPLEPLADPNLDTRIITVDSNTKITLSVRKDPVQFQKEMQTFQSKMQASQQTTSTKISAPILPPMPFEEKVIKLADLKPNQQISVTANEDIRNKKEFTATKINVQEIFVVNP